jgi:hypothetical protein
MISSRRDEVLVDVIDDWRLMASDKHNRLAWNLCKARDAPLSSPWLGRP